MLINQLVRLFLGLCINSATRFFDCLVKIIVINQGVKSGTPIATLYI